MINHYNKVAKILLETEHPITIYKLSVISNISTVELTQILKFFVAQNYLKYKDDWNKILLNDNIRNK